MIESTFVLLKGIGEHTERRLWADGVPDWMAFLGRTPMMGISRARKVLYDDALAGAHDRLTRGDARYFATCLKPRDQWRLYERFGANAVYLDIETTGAAGGDITVVGLYGRGGLCTLIRGESLTARRLADELSGYDLIVTFFGSVFDLPCLRAAFPSVSFDQPHIDLCFVAKRLGLTGGLKAIEPLIGLERPPAVAGLNGWDAVRLWEAWRRGDHASRELLIAYNAADAQNLKPLAEHLCTDLALRYRAAAGLPRAS